MILIVDDSPETGVPLRRLLERVGCRVEYVESGREALEMMEMVRPECVVLDLMMPGVSGLDVLEAMRRRRETADVPVMMYSAVGGDEWRRRATELGASEFVGKGQVEWPELVGRIMGMCAGGVS